MALEAWTNNPELGKHACTTERDSWQCPNMKRRENDRDMTGENYDCALCGRHEWLDYDDMR